MVVYYEYIAINLEQIVYLSYQHMLSVLYYSIKGFQILLDRWKNYFTIQSYMIGINNQGQVKVWFNRNYWEQGAKPSYLLLKTSTKEIA